MRRVAVESAANERLAGQSQRRHEPFVHLMWMNDPWGQVKRDEVAGRVAPPRRGDAEARAPARQVADCVNAVADAIAGKTGVDRLVVNGAAFQMGFLHQRLLVKTWVNLIRTPH